MLKRIFVLLLVLVALAAVSINTAGAQYDLMLRAITVKGTYLLLEPNADADRVQYVPMNTTVDIVSADVNLNYAQVTIGDLSGWMDVDDLMFVNLVPLGDILILDNARGASAAVYAVPDLGGEILATLDNGAEVTSLGVNGEWYYVMTPDGVFGWVVNSGFFALSADAQKVQVSVSIPDIGVYSEASIRSDKVGAIANGTMVYIFGAADAWTQVIAPDGTQGFALANQFGAPMPKAYITAEVSRALAGLYAEADLTSDIVGELENGKVVTYLGAVDGLWIQVFVPGYGDVYALSANFGNPFTVGTVQKADALVRAGPNDTIYEPIGQLAAGVKAVILGKNSDGSMVQVALPFSELDYASNGLEGWMRTFLFEDSRGGMDFDPGILAQTTTE